MPSWATCGPRVWDPVVDQLLLSSPTGVGSVAQPVEPNPLLVPHHSTSWTKPSPCPVPLNQLNQTLCPTPLNQLKQILSLSRTTQPVEPNPPPVPYHSTSWTKPSPCPAPLIQLNQSLPLSRTIQPVEPNPSLSRTTQPVESNPLPVPHHSTSWTKPSPCSVPLNQLNQTLPLSRTTQPVEPNPPPVPHHSTSWTKPSPCPTPLNQLNQTLPMSHTTTNDQLFWKSQLSFEHHTAQYIICFSFQHKWDCFGIILNLSLKICCSL